MDMDFIQIHIHMDFNEQIKKNEQALLDFSFKNTSKKHYHDKVAAEGIINSHKRLSDLRENCLIINYRIYEFAHEIIPQGIYEFFLLACFPSFFIFILCE